MRYLEHYTDLDRLAQKHGTDKGSANVNGLSGKGYAQHYEEVFRYIRDEPITLLEIGVARGASLRMWREYFPHGNIVGIDKRPLCKRKERDRIQVFIGDQKDKLFLKDVIRKIGQPDIIIDDGGHTTELHIASFSALFPHLKPNGVYAIEDLRTVLHEENNTIQRLQEAAGQMYSKRRGPFAHVESIHFYKGLAFLFKPL